MLCLVDVLGGRNFKFRYFKNFTFAHKKSDAKLKRRDGVTIPPFNCPEIEVQKTSSGNLLEK